MFLQMAGFFFLLSVAGTAILSIVPLSIPTPTAAPELTPTSTPKLTLTPTPLGNKSKTLEASRTEEIWGVAKQIDDNTWTMKIGGDQKMAAAQEILEALNSYRLRKGVGTLAWDEKLTGFAQKRAETFVSIGGLDNHAGFNDYFKDEQGLRDIGFWGAGENSSYGFQMEAVHLIEWVYAGDPPHDNNQLDPGWTHVGIGVKGTATNIIFAKEKM